MMLTDPNRSHLGASTMLARHKWQVATIAVLEDVFAHRAEQREQYGSNDDLYDGTGPDVQWLPLAGWKRAEDIEKVLRLDYEEWCESEPPTWLHLVREEVAEAAVESDAQRLEAELIQVAALCVSWVEQLRRRGAAPLPEAAQ